MRFKVDENLPREVAQLLQQAGHDATSVLAQHLGGSPDTAIAAVCQQERRVLLTLFVSHDEQLLVATLMLDIGLRMG